MSSHSQKQQVMEWTEDHDVLLLREMAGSDLFNYKKGSPDRGKIWDAIMEQLNNVQSVKFIIKDKRSVRDRWHLLQTKFKKRMREEKKASGIDPDMSERDVLVEELCEIEESMMANNEKNRAAKVAEKEAANDVRMKAMQRMKGKRMNAESDSKSDNEGGKKSRRSGGDVVEFLREKAESEREIRQKELVIKQQEQERREKQHDDMLKLMAQQQLAMMAVIQKLAYK